MAAKPASAGNRRSKRSRSNQPTETVTKVHRAELLHNQLLAKHRGMPMRALWEALNDKTLASEVAMAVINDPRCGIERRSAAKDGEMSNVTFDLTLRSGATPLMLAALAGRVDVMEALLSVSAAVDAKEDTVGYTALHIAARTHSSLAIEMLIGGGGHVNATDNDGSIPLHWAVRDSEAVKLLIAEGSDASATDNLSSTPLHCAARHGNLEAVKLLIASGSDVYAVFDSGAYFGGTPLHWAAIFNKL